MRERLTKWGVGALILLLCAAAGVVGQVNYYPAGGAAGLTSNGTVITSSLPLSLPDGTGSDGASSIMWGSGATSTPRIWRDSSTLYIGLSATNWISFSGATLTINAVSGQYRLSTDLLFTREAAATLQMGADAATGTAQTIKGPDSTGANVTGASLTLKAGAGTSGNATGGQLILQGGAFAGTGEAGAVAIADGGTKPTCAVGIRGSIWYDAGGAGVADTFEVCAKQAAGDSYAWRVLATIP